MPVNAMTLVWWLIDAVVGFAAGWGLGTWRGTCKGHAEFAFGMVENKAALRNFLKGEVARKGGLDALAKGIKKDTAFGTVIDEMFNRMEILRVSSMAAEYVFYAFVVAIAIGGHYPAPVVGIPVCLMTVKQAAKERGGPLGAQTMLQLFGLLHVWLRENPVDALNYVKIQKVPVRNIIDVLRESGGYAI
jgi:hypothetical protein